MIKTKTWVIMIICLCVVLSAASAVMLTRHRDSTVVEIVQDGTVIKEIDLAAVTQAYSFSVYWEDGGSNVITVQPGRICVSGADCPDLVCVKYGWLTDQAAPIVCMPHRLLIRLKTVTGADAAVQ